MADDETKDEAKERGPVRYIAFAEITPGHWVLMGEPGREATSVHVLRKEVRAEIDAATAAAGRTPNDAHDLVLVPFDRAHIVTAARDVEVRETFRKATLKAGPDLSTVIRQEETEADVAARMAAGPVPDDAIVSPPPTPTAETGAGTVAAPVDEAAARRAEAERVAAAAAAAIPADVDPDTLLSRRTADEAVPQDEGKTVFPMDER